MRLAAMLVATVSAAGCASAGADEVGAAPSEASEPGFAESAPALSATPNALGAAIQSIDAPETPVPAPAAKPQDPWSFAVTPFLWLAGVEVSTGSSGRKEVADSDAGHLLFELKGALLLHAETRHGRFFAFGEVVWFDLAADVSEVRPAMAGQVGVDGEVTVEQTLAMLAGGWRLVEAPLDCDDPSKLFILEPFVGARYTTGRIGVDVDVQGPGGTTRTIDNDVTPGWWDPVIGFRASAAVMNGVTLTGRLDLGGFGVGAEQAVLAKLGADCRLSDSMSLEVGWLLYDSHYKQGGDVDPIVLNEKLSGPYFALTIRF